MSLIYEYFNHENSSLMFASNKKTEEKIHISFSNPLFSCCVCIYVAYMNELVFKPIKRRNWEIWFDINILLSFRLTTEKDKFWLV